MSHVLVTNRSGNKKVGDILVTTSDRKTCPPACPFKNNGCYADFGPLGMIWDKLTKAEPSATVIEHGRGKIKLHTHKALCTTIAELPEGSLWRHNQAGDLAGSGNGINNTKLKSLTKANEGRKGFTYSHKPVLGETIQAANNRLAIRDANAGGFTVNISGNNLDHADKLADLAIGPVVSVVPIDQMENTTTPAGRKVVICPVVTGKTASCKTCGLCQIQKRDFIVGFPAHGTSKKKANAIAAA